MLLFTPEPAYISRYHPANSRERYLRALAEEEAARRLYANDLAQQFTNPYYDSNDASNYYPVRYHPTGDDLLAARAREIQRQRQLAAYHAHREQQLRQQELARELERRKRQLEVDRRRELMRQRQLEQQKQQAAESESFHRARALQEQEREHAFANTLRAFFTDIANKEQRASQTEPITPSSKNDVTPIPISAKKLPTKEELNAAATTIQTFYHSHQHRQKSLKSVSQLRESFATLTSSFIFPSAPIFDPNSLNATSPKLLYNSINGSIHAYEDELVRFLTKLDAIESGGDMIVRNERKVLVQEVEAALAELERMKERAWKSWKEEHTERMEVGEESNAISSASPTGELEPTEEHMVEDLLSAEPNSFQSGNSIEPVEHLLSSPADAMVMETESHETDLFVPTASSELALEDTHPESTSTTSILSPLGDEDFSTSYPESSILGANSSGQADEDGDADAIEVDTSLAVDNGTPDDIKHDDSFLSRTLPLSNCDATLSILAPPVLNEYPSSTVGEPIEDMVIIGDMQDSSETSGTSDLEPQHATDSAEAVSDTSSTKGSEIIISANSGAIENDFVMV